MKSKRNNKNKVYTIEGGILGSGLYAGVAILDTSEIEDLADYGGLLYELKKMGIRDGEEYQIDNGGDLLMYYDSYKKCKNILKKFKVTAANL
ncbi:MAG: hypothetical protein ACE5KZ_09460 [Candidatus Scalinduaceae bacterium]